MKLKKIRTISQLKIYTSEDKKYYYRIGKGRIKRLSLLPRRWYSRLALVLLLIALAGWAAYKPVMHYAANKVIEKVADQLLTQEEIEEIMNMPKVQQILKEQDELLKQLPIPDTTPSVTSQPVVTTPSTSSSLPTSSNTPPTPEKDSKEDKLRFSSNEEALEFLLTKFSMKELSNMASMAKDGLTSDEKIEIKATVLEKLSPDEYEALKILAVLELKKRQG